MDVRNFINSLSSGMNSFNIIIQTWTNLDTSLLRARVHVSECNAPALLRILMKCVHKMNNSANNWAKNTEKQQDIDKGNEER